MSNKEIEEGDDTSDEDYVPGGADCAQVSEEESDGDPEDDCNGSEDESSNKRKKRKSKSKLKRNKKRKAESDQEEAEEKPQNTELNEEEQKKKTDSLWADFLKDTDFKPKPKPAVTTEKATDDNTKNSNNKVNKPKVPTILEFAGERVNIPERNSETCEKQSTSQPKPLPTPVSLGARKPRGGMSSVLSQLGKKQKINTLEKSKLDWDRFKQEENITDELTAFNKGKNGYLERQDFLQRADLRQFELEKQARARQRSHRLN